MITLKTPTGQKVRVAESRVGYWEARGYPRVDQPAETTTPEVPAKSANKSEWVEHAVARGVDRAKAEASTKAQLVKRFGD